MSETGPSAPPATGTKSFLVAWLLSLLLGILGVDRFYLGKVGTGIIKLLTFGGLGIWYLIDLIMVLAGAMRDKNGLTLEGYDKSKLLAWIVTGVVVLASAAVGVSNDGGSVPSNRPSSSSSDSAAEEQEAPEEEADEAPPAPAPSGTPGIGDTARTDDGVDATLISVSGAVSTPNNWIIDDPKGELIAVEMEMFNDSDEPVNLSSSSVVAYIGTAKYEASAVLGPSGDWFIFEDVNPKLGTKFTAYFDVPVGASINQVEFSSAAFFGDSVIFDIQ
jgi:TM2 domain-containing membrane protein YozV